MYKNFDKSRKPLKLTPSMTERKNESRFLTRPYNKNILYSPVRLYDELNSNRKLNFTNFVTNKIT